MQIEVKDSGIGMKLKDQNNMFKMFSTISSSRSTMNKKGVGLGLYICKLIVNAFGGTITVNSEFGKGSIFTFNFILSEATPLKKEPSL